MDNKHVYYASVWEEVTLHTSREQYSVLVNQKGKLEDTALQIYRLFLLSKTTEDVCFFYLVPDGNAAKSSLCPPLTVVVCYFFFF